MNDDHEIFKFMISELEKRLDERFRAQERALDKAELSMTRRLDSMNEIRDQLRDQATTFLRRDTFEAALTEWTNWREIVNSQLNISSGTASGRSATLGSLIAVITAGVAVLGVIVLIVNLMFSR